MTDPKAEYMTESTELLPCPFCGGKDIDERGWLSGDGGAGPQCMNCGATAEPQWWNTRAESPDSVETCDYCNARLNAASECDNDECDVFEYKPTPPVAGGVVISREDAEEVLAYCNADFIAQGALLNSCVLQTLTAKAIVEGRRCRMGAIAAKLEAALGERNNG